MSFKIVLKFVICGKVEKTGVRKSPKYGLPYGRKNKDFMAFYSPIVGLFG